MTFKQMIMLSMAGLFCLTLNAQAERPYMTRERFIARRLAWAENNPHWNPTRQELEEHFDRLDLDGDGELSEAELALERPEDRGFGAVATGLTKQQFVRQNMEWARNNPHWNPTRADLEALFDEWDTNGDGILTEEEREAGRAARRAERGE